MGEAQDLHDEVIDLLAGKEYARGDRTRKWSRADRMGLLKKIVDAQRPLSPAVERLNAVCFAIGSAISQTDSGSMPPDFLDAVVEAPGFHEALRAVADEQGPEKATKLARKSIQATAEGGYIGAGIPRAGLRERVDGVMRRLLVDA